MMNFNVSKCPERSSRTYQYCQNGGYKIQLRHHLQEIGPGIDPIYWSHSGLHIPPLFISTPCLTLLWSGLPHVNACSLTCLLL